MPRRHLPSPFAFAVVAAFAVAAPVAGAQERTATDSLAALATTTPAVPAADVVPAVAPAPVAATRPAVPADVPADAFRAARAREAGVAVAQAGSAGQGKVYMIVGGAAFLAGAIIGGDAGTLIMVGGAGVGIYGLYLFLQ